MKKGFSLYVCIAIMLLVLFNVVCFVTPSEINGVSKYTGAFWSGYVLITAMIVIQVVCAYFAFKAENLEKMFYNVSFLQVAWTGLILMFIFGGLAMALPFVPYWVGIILCAAILCFTVIAVAKAETAASVIPEIEKKVKNQTLFIKSLTVDAEGLVARAQTDEIKEECRQVYEAVRYSDPMSVDALSGIESQITLKLASLADAVQDNSIESVKELAREVKILLDDRNKKCKVLK